MPTIINADTSNGLKLTSDTSGQLELQSAGTTIATVSSTGIAMASGKTVSGDISYAARAWVNFNGTGTVAIRASGNVSSITDNGSGKYTINFATAMSDINYSVVGSTIQGNGVGAAGAQYVVGFPLSNIAASSVQLTSKYIRPDTSGFVDIVSLNVAIFR